jgi:predicted ArsR family transcriptional regulator
MARPVGEAHVLILQHIERAGPVTARELANGLQLSVRASTRYLHYLAATGRIEVVGRVRVPHMTRPAMRYQVRVAEQGVAWGLLASWPRGPQSQDSANDDKRSNIR